MPEPTSKRLLLIGNFLHDGKSSTAVGEGIARHLKKHGWQTTCVSRYSNPVLKVAEIVGTLLLHHRRFAACQLDVFSGRAFIWAEIASSLLSFLRVPFIATLHGGNLPVFAKHNARRLAKVLNRAGHVTAPSAYLQTTLNPYTSHEIEILPNPLALDSIEPRIRQQAAPKLVWLRALEEIYNVTMAVEVIAELRPKYPEIKLYIVGPDKQDGTREKLEASIARLHVENHVEYVGPVPKAEVPAWMQKGDIFLNTTTVDNTPVSVLEAAACGLCIVTTNVGGIPFMFRSSEAAILVESKRPDQMAQAVRDVLTSPEKAHRMSTAAVDLTRTIDYSSVCKVWDARLRAISRNRKN